MHETSAEIAQHLFKAAAAAVCSISSSSNRSNSRAQNRAKTDVN
jgi:hypothetical protein